MWEARAPLTPAAVEELAGVHTFIVQASSQRVFPDDQFAKAGATIQEDLSTCDLVMGIKEVPPADLLPGKAYLHFSHTHKGQRHNLPTVDECIRRDVQLLDYELLTDAATGRRLVAFGKHAGYAGAINALHGLGLQLLRQRKQRSPLLYISLAHSYPSVEAAKRCLCELDMSTLTSPLVLCVTGDGNVSQGALEILDCIPGSQRVERSQLASLTAPGVYIFQCVGRDYLQKRRSPDDPFDFADYLKCPGEYDSTFERDVAPSIDCLVNGIFWAEPSPRLLTDSFLDGHQRRLLSVADISCDLGGSIEFTRQCTTIDEPFMMVGKDTQLMSIDNLPAQLPRDASEHFSRCLSPLLKDKDFLASDVFARATIVHNRQIASAYSPLLGNLLRESLKRYVVFGSGYVTGPVLDYLTQEAKSIVTVVSDVLPSEQDRRAGVVYRTMKVHEKISKGEMDAVLADCDVAISLLPAAMHAWIGRHCLRLRKHLITASYVSPAMQALSEEAKALGLTFLNEVGLDPGLDHMSAMQVIDQMRREGFATVEHFESWCGGLPSPTVVDNPFAYKFSWSPKGVLLAAQNDAIYVEHGRREVVTGEHLLRSYRHLHTLFPALNLQGIPNRDSTQYIQTYGFEARSLGTMLRGTLRYAGFFDRVEGLRRLGFLFASRHLPQASITTWRQASQHLLVMPTTTTPTDKDFEARVMDLYATEDSDPVVARQVWEALQWLGLFSAREPFDSRASVLDNLAALMQRRMPLGPGEPDAVLMHHTMRFSSPHAGADGGRHGKAVTCKLQCFGNERYSAMARTVGFPTAIAARMLAETPTLHGRGVCIPTTADLYDPILAEVASVDPSIRFEHQHLLL